LHPLETYIHELNNAHALGAGVKELTYYNMLSNLFNEVGRELNPKVFTLFSLRNVGAGLPDGGFFTADQIPSGFVPSFKGELPAPVPYRGAIEVKGTSEDLESTITSEQVQRYLERYSQVLVTNLREFALVGKDAEGKLVILDQYALAPTAETFWKSAAHPRKIAQEQGERFLEFLKRVMLHPAPLALPKDLAWILASYAKEAKGQLAGSNLQSLAPLRRALEHGLGLQFEGEKGEHFFLSSLVQTLFYGIFSAWVLWSKRHQNPGDTFDWRLTAYELNIHVLGELFHQLTSPQQLQASRLTSILDRAGEALNRVDRLAFFQSFQEEQAVQYFYEPFLEAFDPQLRKDLGVWYTPQEIVQYMVARVDRVLQEELGIADGLADPRVYVLDPCCGTGTFLLETLKQIERTLQERRGDALIANDLKKAALERVFGFEILLAPFVIAHLQVGLLLQNAGIRLKQDEQLGIHLTNSLTGWAGNGGEQGDLPFPELEEERDAAAKIKRQTPILVVLGNPPYNAFAGVSPKEEQGLVVPYKQGLISEWGIKKFNLDDLYVRFFRLAERRIAEMTGQGIVCYVSNFSWVSDSSFVVLRQNLLRSFDRFWIENLHGNRKISEYAPDGRTSETIFATKGFSPGIQQGVATSLWLKSGKQYQDQVLFRDEIDAARASERRAQLLQSLDAEDFNALYQAARPDRNNRFSFQPSDASAEYLQWPRLVDLAEIPPITGYKENRGFSLIDDSKQILKEKMMLYYNPAIAWMTLEALNSGLTQDVAGFDADKTRIKVLRAENFKEDNLKRYLLRPFEVKWCYYSQVSPLWNRARPSLFQYQVGGNSFLVSRPSGVADPEGFPMLFTHVLVDFDCIRGHSYNFPMQLFAPDGHIQSSNLAFRSKQYLQQVGLMEQDGLYLWRHALAIGYSLDYLEENADGIRQDWPRIPLPDSKELLIASAELGQQIAGLLDTETQVSGVTSGPYLEPFRSIAVLSKVGGGQLQPDAGELALTAGWGHAGKAGITMPGKGKTISRDYTDPELESIRLGAERLILSLDQAMEALGEKTLDVYLNGVAYWCNIPEKVWEFTIGGYQVLKKWLSYREKSLLNRDLRPEEAQEVSATARRLTALCLLQPQLDANYQAIKGAAFPWTDRTNGILKVADASNSGT
jgi:hypothetical protein